MCVLIVYCNRIPWYSTIASYVDSTVGFCVKISNNIAFRQWKTDGILFPGIQLYSSWTAESYETTLTWEENGVHLSRVSSYKENSQFSSTRERETTRNIPIQLSFDSLFPHPSFTEDDQCISFPRWLIGSKSLLILHSHWNTNHFNCRSFLFSSTSTELISPVTPNSPWSTNLSTFRLGGIVSLLCPISLNFLWSWITLPTWVNKMFLSVHPAISDGRRSSNEVRVCFIPVSSIDSFPLNWQRKFLSSKGEVLQMFFFSADEIFHWNTNCEWERWRNESLMEWAVKTIDKKCNFSPPRELRAKDRLEKKLFVRVFKQRTHRSKIHEDQRVGQQLRPF